MSKQESSELLDRILEKDKRFHRDAYIFVGEAVDFTQKAISKANKGKIRHITGKELLAGIRAFAVDQYGPMAMMLLNEWGIKNCQDFGDIVFNMVEQGLLKKTDTDTRADFQGGYDFHEAFCKPFVPKHRTGSQAQKQRSPSV